MRLLASIQEAAQMATESQMNANRANAQRSTGPTSEEGKSRSRENSLKHGAYIVLAEIAGVDPQILIEREQAYFAHYKPQTPGEIFQVKAMIAAENEHEICVALQPFTLKAVLKVENSENPVGEGVVEDAKKSNALQKLAGRKNRAYSNWLRSAKELERLQAKRAKTPNPAPEAQPEPEIILDSADVTSGMPNPESE